MATRVAAGIRALAVLALLASACGSTPSAATGRASSARTASVTPDPTPTLMARPCSATSNPCLALVKLRGSSAVVVRDITDINHPKTVATFKDFALQFVSGTEVSYVEDNTLNRRSWIGPTGSGQAAPGIGPFAWNPKGTSAVYITQGGTVEAVHLLSSRGDLVIGSIPAGGIGGCETISSCTLPNWLDSQLAFSPDGTYISLVINSFSGSVFRVWSSDGKLINSNDGHGATMSTWSGQGLYFRDAKGVEVWRAGAVSPFLTGVIWIKPKGSPAGGQIVYTARDSGGWGQIFLVDTSTRKIRLLKTARTDAVFLTSRYIWYQVERACVAADHCGPHPPFHPLSGKTYIYDLQDGTETESIITSVQDIWPHAA